MLNLIQFNEIVWAANLKDFTDIETRAQGERGKRKKRTRRIQ